MKATGFDKKHLKKAGEHIGRNVVYITIKMRTTDEKSKYYKLSIFI